MKNEIEIHFSTKGNTVVGNYSVYTELDAAIARKDCLYPHGLSIGGSVADIKRLTDYVLTFGNCLKSNTAWLKCFHLSGVELI